MFWLSYERWDFADFGEFWYKLGGRTTGVGVQAGNRLLCATPEHRCEDSRDRRKDRRRGR